MPPGLRPGPRGAPRTNTNALRYAMASRRTVTHGMFWKSRIKPSAPALNTHGCENGKEMIIKRKAQKSCNRRSAVPHLRGVKEHMHDTLPASHFVPSKDLERHQQRVLQQVVEDARVEDVNSAVVRASG